VAAVLAVTVFSYRAADQAVQHRGTRPAVTPADSGLAYSVVPLRARDGTDLEGWWITPADGVRRPDLAVVVLAHPEDDSLSLAREVGGKARMLRHAGYLHRAGFIVLLFDFRSYGGSSGSRTSGGYLEQQDLEGAIRLARERALGAPIAVVGEGMGATVGLAVTAQDPTVTCLVADSPTPAWNAALFPSPSIRGAWWSAFVVPPLAAYFAGREFPTAFLPGGFDGNSPVALKAAPLAGMRPVMLVFGREDDAMPNATRIALAKALGPSNLTWAWAAPSARRLEVFDAAPADYETRVLEFLDSAIAQWARRKAVVDSVARMEDHDLKSGRVDSVGIIVPTL
jgi:pimeloyl-ACP methyl ester carboxylesterase